MIPPKNTEVHLTHSMGATTCSKIAKGFLKLEFSFKCILVCYLNYD
jgi:hypothetical protein